MRIASGVTDQYIYFVAVDITDLKTRETGLSGFTVYRSRNGGVAAAYTTPTINETDTTNMPGVYELLLDEDVTIDSGDETQEICLHITHASMAPVTRVIELYRPKITAGNTLDVTSTGAAGIDWGNIENKGSTVDLSATDINLCDTITTYTGNTKQTADHTSNIAAILDDTGTNGVLLAGTATSAQLVDDIWDEDVDLSHQTAGTSGKKLDDAGAAGDPWSTALPGAYGAGTAGKIVGDNINAPVGTVDTVVDGIQTDLDNATEGLGALKALIDTVDTVADAIKVVTDKFVFTVANQVDANTLSISGMSQTANDVGLDVNEILTDTGTTLDTKLNDIQGATFSSVTDSLEAIRNKETDIETYVDILDDATSGNVKIATDVAAALVDTNSLNDTKIPDTISLANINAEVDTALNTAIPGSPTSDSINDVLNKQRLGIVSSTCAAGSTTTVIETNLTEATDDHYNGRVVVWTGGALLGQATDITDYNGTTKQLTVTVVTEAPANTDSFLIV